MRGDLQFDDYAVKIDGYVDGVLEGRIQACRAVRLACERHRRDLERAEAGGPFVFSREHASAICAFVETMPHIEGEWARRGETLKLEPWQMFVLGSINGWRRRDGGHRRFRTVYLEVPRKNGKSALAAPLGLFLLTMDREAGAKVFTAATKMKQAKIVFNVARAMARRNRSFTRYFGLKVEEHQVKTLDSTSVFAALEAKNLDGSNVHAAIVDELHEHPTPAVWEALDQARGARLQSLLFAITTAGEDIAGVCFEKRDYLIKVLEGIYDDDTWFGAIFTIDEGDDPFDERVWAKANPNLGVSKYVDSMRAEATEAKASPAKKGSFLRKQMNIWTAAGATAFDMDGYAAGEDATLDRADYAAAAGAVTALDLARRHDFAVVATVIPQGERLIAFADVFATGSTLRAEGAERLFGWARDGLIIECGDDLMDYEMIEACARGHLDHFGSEEFAYDPHFAAQMANSLAADYPEGVVVEVRNTAMTLDQPFQLLQGVIREGRFVTNGSPALRWQAANTVIREARNGFQTPDKLRKANKIDFISGVCMAMARIEAPEEEPAHAPISIGADYFIG